MDRNSLKSELQNTLQSKLPELRNELGLSQEGFAELIGKPRQAVSPLERDEIAINNLGNMLGNCRGCYQSRSKHLNETLRR